VSGALHFKSSPTQERAVNVSKAIRQFHRWVSIIFTLTVIANFAVRSQGEPLPWVTYSPLLPLFLLMLTGLYMFFLPYVARRRAHESETRLS
jgi:sterol desaturase/sphingolipid hydroxylase (fatty acid hydroxylase superfamily)